MIKWTKAGGGNMLRVSPDEALRIIKSLSVQMLEKNPNVGREEFYDGVRYFSIAVHEKP